MDLSDLALFVLTKYHGRNFQNARRADPVKRGGYTLQVWTEIGQLKCYLRAVMVYR